VQHKLEPMRLKKVGDEGRFLMKGLCSRQTIHGHPGAREIRKILISQKQRVYTDEQDSVHCWPFAVLMHAGRTNALSP
jgi:hypothetical protein